MMRLPINVVKSLEKRKATGAFRELKFSKDAVDFTSNDYLGFAGNQQIFERTGAILREYSLSKNGSGGSRLLSGNHLLYPVAEAAVAAYHKAESALIFNSGYDANLGLFSAVPRRGDAIFYDEFIHASIRDGINLSAAKAFKFKHNNLEDLKAKVDRLKHDILGEVYIVTESIFSMDGDTPDLHSFCRFASESSAHLIVDEAHSVGVQEAGFVARAGLEQQVFARIITFGKALGVHGAAIVGPEELTSFLVNYARSFIYSTALPPHSVASILAAYGHLENEGTAETGKLQENIRYFKAEVTRRGLEKHFLKSESAIHCCILPGNERVKSASKKLLEAKFDVRPILSPTVPEGKERLRICLHSFNSKEEIVNLLEVLKQVL